MLEYLCSDKRKAKFIQLGTRCVAQYDSQHSIYFEISNVFIQTKPTESRLYSTPHRIDHTNQLVCTLLYNEQKINTNTVRMYIDRDFMNNLDKQLALVHSTQSKVCLMTLHLKFYLFYWKVFFRKFILNIDLVCILMKCDFGHSTWKM